MWNVATECGYNKGMLAIGVRKAKNELSKLIEAALSGEKVVITNHGRASVRLVPEAPEGSANRGIGCLKGAVDYPDYWFSPEGEAAFAALFEGETRAALKHK